MNLKSCYEMWQFNVTCWVTLRRMSTMFPWKRATMTSNRPRLWRKSDNAFWLPFAMLVLRNISTTILLRFFCHSYLNWFINIQNILLEFRIKKKRLWDILEIEMFGIFDCSYRILLDSLVSVNLIFKLIFFQIIRYF